jgi:AcrR family transcriptional regulator
MVLEHLAGRSPIRRHHGYTAVRKAILDTAREIMRVDGVGALSLNELARRLGMKTPSLYTYFPSKHALYDELFRLGMQAYRQRSTELFTVHRLNEDLFEAVITDYMRFADENPDLYALLFERPVPGFVPTADSMSEATGLLEDSERRMQEALDAGLIRTGLSAAATRDLFITVMHGLTSLKRANEPDAPFGSGRFGGLVPAAVALVKTAWMAPAAPTNQGGRSS